MIRNSLFWIAILIIVVSYIGLHYNLCFNLNKKNCKYYWINLLCTWLFQVCLGLGIILLTASFIGYLVRSIIMLLTLSPISDPEALAMMQAFYSRSHKSIKARLDELNTDDITKIKKALNKYYIGYNHDSIGKCGNITIFIEGVSLLAAKAIQSNPLYAGQESSTRYIDFDRDFPVINPVIATELSHDVFNAWFKVYNFVKTKVYEALSKLYPKPDFITDFQYHNALASATQDLARGYLPTGTKTQLAWTTNMQAIREHCLYLRSHPLLEIQQLALEIQTLCSQHYPFAFPVADIHKLDEQDLLSGKIAHQLERNILYNIPKEINVDTTALKIDLLKVQVDYLQRNAPNIRLPRYLNKYGTITATGWLDFGSFRDLQRHQNATIPISELHLDSKPHPYYQDTVSRLLPKSDVFQFVHYVDLAMESLHRISKIIHNKDLQYFYPLCWMVPVSCTAGFPQWVYMLKLRTSKSVHSTLRMFMQNIGNELNEKLPVTLEYDNTASELINFDRGLQTITTSMNLKGDC